MFTSRIMVLCRLRNFGTVPRREKEALATPVSPATFDDVNVTEAAILTSATRASASVERIGPTRLITTATAAITR